MKTSIGKLQPLVFLVFCLPLFGGLDLAFGYSNEVLVLQIGRGQLSFSREALHSFQSCLCSSESCSVSLRVSVPRLKYLADRTSAMTDLALSQPPSSRTVFACKWTRSHLFDFTPDSLDCQVMQNWKRSHLTCDGRNNCEMGLLMSSSCPRQCVELISAYSLLPVVKVLDMTDISRGGCRETTPRSVVMTSTDTLITAINSTDVKMGTASSNQDSVARDVTLLVLGVITLGVLFVIITFLVRRRKRFAIKSQNSHQAQVENLYCSIEVGGTTPAASVSPVTSSLPITLHIDVRNEDSIYDEVDNIDSLCSNNLHRPQQSSELPTCLPYSLESPASTSYCKRDPGQSQSSWNLTKKSASFDLGVSQPSFGLTRSSVPCSRAIHDPSPTLNATRDPFPSLTLTRDSAQNETACSEETTARGNNRSAANSNGTHPNTYLHLYQDENNYSEPTFDNRSSTHSYETLNMKPVQVSKKPKVSFKSLDNNGKNDGYECVD